jgi:hypothetical protein
MDNFDQTVQGALETILGFEDAITEVEVKAGELFHHLENSNVDPQPLYEIFRIFSDLRFQMAEAHEYQALLEERRKKSRKRNGAAMPPLPEADAPGLRPAVSDHGAVEARFVHRLKAPYTLCGNYLRTLLSAR